MFTWQDQIKTYCRNKKKKQNSQHIQSLNCKLFSPKQNWSQSKWSEFKNQELLLLASHWPRYQGFVSISLSKSENICTPAQTLAACGQDFQVCVKQSSCQQTGRIQSTRQLRPLECLTSGGQLLGWRNIWEEKGIHATQSSTHSHTEQMCKKKWPRRSQSAIRVHQAGGGLWVRGKSKIKATEKKWR